MHSYKSLTVLALAVSTASTAYSAPVQESQQQARSMIGVPLNVGRDDLPGGLNISSILSHLHGIKINRPEASRDIVDLDQRASVSAAGNILSDLLRSSTVKNILTSVAGGAAGAGAGFLTDKLLNSTRRDSPLDLSDCSRLSPNEAGVCTIQRYIERDDVSTRDVIDILQVLKRQLIELD